MEAGDVALAEPPAAEAEEARHPIGFAIEAMEPAAAVAQAAPARDAATKVREAKILGFTGDSCGECGSMKMVRNGTCVKCIDCGSTTGCS